MKGLLNYALVMSAALVLGACATESHRAIEPQKVATYGTSYSGERSTLLVGNFQNKSDYMQGIFASDTDRLGNQAKSILKTHLQQTNRFNLVDRDNMDDLQREAALAGVEQKLSGARFVVAGSVTEFGRKEVGDKQLFGLLGRGKEQIAYAKVALNLVDVQSSAIVYSTQGAGEYALSNREVVGFGGTAGYDATLNGKVLNFAITEAVNNLARDLDAGILRLK